ARCRRGDQGSVARRPLRRRRRGRRRRGRAHPPSSQALSHRPGAMKRGPDVADLRLWSVVTATVRPLAPKASLPLVGREGEAEPRRVGEADAARKPHAPRSDFRHPQPGATRPAPAVKGREAPPAGVDAALHRRLARGREALAARIDLHGMTHDAARAALTRFIARAAGDGWRAVLVITGKGTQGDGLLRRRTPDWLAEPPLRQHVAGVSE